MSDRDHQLVKKHLKIDSDRTSKVGDVGAYFAAGAFNPLDGLGLCRDEWDDDRDHQLVKKDLKIDSDRTSKVDDAGAYAAAGAFNCSDGAGVYAGAGLGGDEWDGGEGKGPNVGAGAELSLAGGARAVVNADLVRVSQSVGPGKVTLGLSAETGGTISPTQVEAKVLGTGISFGRKMGFSILGNGFEFKLW